MSLANSLKESGRSPALLFCPRSGSTLASQILGNFFCQNLNLPYLGELLNTDWNFQFTSFGLLNKSPNPHVNHLYAVALHKCHEPLEGLRVRRFMAFMNLRRKGFFKFAGEQLEPKTRQMIKDHFFVITMIRKDSWEHYLSLMVSLCTGVYYRQGGIRLARRLLRPQWEHFARARYLMLEFERTRHEMNFGAEVFYEDIVEMGPHWWLLHLGFDGDLGGVDLAIPEKQSKSNKIDLFLNPHEVELRFECLQAELSKLRVTGFQSLELVQPPSPPAQIDFLLR